MSNPFMEHNPDLSYRVDRTEDRYTLTVFTTPAATATYYSFDALPEWLRGVMTNLDIAGTGVGLMQCGVPTKMLGDRSHYWMLARHALEGQTEDWLTFGADKTWQVFRDNRVVYIRDRSKVFTKLYL